MSYKMEKLNEGAKTKQLKSDLDLNLEKSNGKSTVEETSYEDYKFYEGIAFSRSLIVQDLIAKKSLSGVSEVVDVIMKEVMFEMMKCEKLGLLLKSTHSLKLAEDIRSHIKDQITYRMELPQYLTKAAPVIKSTEIQTSFFVISKKESMLEQISKSCDFDLQGQLAHIRKAKWILSKFLLQEVKVSQPPLTMEQGQKE